MPEEQLMEYGALTLLPIIFIIVMAVLTRKSFESLLAGSVLACIIMHGSGFFLPWVNTLVTALIVITTVWSGVEYFYKNRDVFKNVD